MRRALACLLMIAALTTPAGAQVRAKPTTVVPAVPGAQPAARPALPPPLIPLTGAAQGLDPNQCRASCSRTYYFCRANGDDDGCPTQWMQCKSRCTATYSPRPLGN